MSNLKKEINYNDFLSLKWLAFYGFSCPITGKKISKFPAKGTLLAKNMQGDFVEVDVAEICQVHEMSNTDFLYCLKSDYEELVAKNLAAEKKSLADVAELQKRVIPAKQERDPQLVAELACIQLLKSIDYDIANKFCVIKDEPTDKGGYAHFVRALHFHKKTNSNYIELLETIKKEIAK
jgi:hypothetical protein